MDNDTVSFPAVVTLEDAAAALGISKATAYTLRRTNRFPVRVLKVGSQYRVLRSELDAFLRGTEAAAS